MAVPPNERTQKEIRSAHDARYVDDARRRAFLEMNKLMITYSNAARSEMPTRRRARMLQRARMRARTARYAARMLRVRCGNMRTMSAMVRRAFNVTV